jgi:hypothetical protein
MITDDKVDPSELMEQAKDLVVSAQHIATLASRDYSGDSFEVASVFEGIAALLQQAWERLIVVERHVCDPEAAEDVAEEKQP